MVSARVARAACSTCLLVVRTAQLCPLLRTDGPLADLLTSIARPRAPAPARAIPPTYLRGRRVRRRCLSSRSADKSPTEACIAPGPRTSSRRPFTAVWARRTAAIPDRSSPPGAHPTDWLVRVVRHQLVGAQHVDRLARRGLKRDERRGTAKFKYPVQTASAGREPLALGGD